MEILSLICFLIMVTSCGFDDDIQTGPDNVNFTVTSSDIICSTNNPSVLVPFAGKVYQLSVTAGKDVGWSVEVESGTDLSPLLHKENNKEMVRLKSWWLSIQIEWREIRR